MPTLTPIQSIKLSLNCTACHDCPDPISSTQTYPTPTPSPPKTKYASSFPFLSNLLSDDPSSAGYNVATILPPYTSQTTKQWAPIALNRCQAWMPPHYAPCLYRNASDDSFYGEQLVFNDFEIRMPFFISASQKALWEETLPRARNWHNQWHPDYEKNTIVFQAQNHAQNLIIRDGIVPELSMKAAGSWRVDKDSTASVAKASCFVSKYADHSIYRPFGSENVSIIHPMQRSKWFTRTVDELVLTHVPDFYSFQHFIDHGLVVIIQNMHLREERVNLSKEGRIQLRNPKSFIMGAPPSPPRSGSSSNAKLAEILARNLVDEMAEKFGYDGAHRISPRAKLRGREMYYSCRAIETHPYFFFRARDVLQVDGSAPTRAEIDSNVMNLVIYMSRRSTGGGGRRVNNEKQLLEGAHELLHARNKNETLVFLDASLGLAPSMYLFSKAKCIIGLHGGMFYNQRFARPHTIVIEFMPIGRFRPMFYEAAHVLNQPYFALLYPSLNDRHDVTVNIEEVLSVLQFGLERYAGTYGMDPRMKQDENITSHELFDVFGDTLLPHSHSGDDSDDDPRVRTGFYNLSQYDLDVVSKVLTKGKVPE